MESRLLQSNSNMQNKSRLADHEVPSFRALSMLAFQAAKLPGITSLWDYRGFILGSVKREFQARYNRSILGIAWTAINPLSMIFIYTIVFSRVMHAKMPGISSNHNSSYGIYLCAGIFAWGLFSEIVSRCVGMFTNNSTLLKKSSFPRLCLPAIEVLSSTLNFLIVFSLLSIFLLISRSFPGYYIIAIIPLTLILVSFALGFGTILGILNVFFRDVGQFSGILLQFWFWLTPIVYTANILPNKAQELLRLNPIAAVIEGYQRVVVSASWPEWITLAYPAALSIVLCYVGYNLFINNSGDIVDEL